MRQVLQDPKQDIHRACTSYLHSASNRPSKHHSIKRKKNYESEIDEAEEFMLPNPQRGDFVLVLFKTKKLLKF